MEERIALYKTTSQSVSQKKQNKGLVASRFEKKHRMGIVAFQIPEEIKHSVGQYLYCHVSSKNIHMHGMRQGVENSHNHTLPITLTGYHCIYFGKLDKTQHTYIKSTR